MTKKKLRPDPPPRFPNKDMGKLPANLAVHRARMLHDVLPSSETYRAILAECVREYDEFKAREKAGRRKVGVRYTGPKQKHAKKKAA
jgi:hypothetical protein